MIGVQRESSSLDFKSEIARKGEEVAKDIAAMTPAGGVLVYGVREDKSTGLADAAPTIKLAGVEERIHQIAKSIEPVPSIELLELRRAETDTHGVVVVTVAKSSRGPHMINGRYVMRHGTTTRWMTEREVAAAYERRRHLSRPVAPGELLSDIGRLPGLSDVRAQSVFDGFGQLRIAARPVDEHVEHPDGVRLKAALEQAVERASQRAAERLAVYNPPTLLMEIDDWAPSGTEGWVAGWAGDDHQLLRAELRSRAPHLADVTRRGLRVGVRHDLLAFVPGGIDAAPALARLPAPEATDAAECWNKAELLGRWLPRAGPPATVLALLGVRP